MTDMERAFRRLLVPQHIPKEQHGEFIDKRKEREQEEYEIHKQNLNVQNS